MAHDFSPDAELAANYALALAEEYQAEVHMLHVISHREQEEPEVAWSHVGLDNLCAGSVRRLRDAVPKQLLRRCKVINVARRGHPADEIVAYAKANEIDLICVGASGAGFSLGTLFGSTVDHVLRRAPCPVWVARPVKSAVASTKVA